MPSAALLRAHIENKIPSAFARSPRLEQKTLLTGIAEIDAMTGGVPMSALTEICGSSLASSGKTSVLVSLLAAAAEKHFCALVDAGDSFDPVSAEAAGMNFGRLLWVRCGKQKSKLRPLEQAFKVADMLLQSGGFGLIAVDLGGIPERVVRRVPLSSWFRFSRVIEKLPAALVFLEQQPHATSCAGLVLQLQSRPAAWQGKLLTQCHVRAEVVRTREKRPPQSARPDFSLKAQWA
jgi:recombination protein RecA